MKHILSIIIGFSVSISSCKKYLDAKPDIKLAVPETLSDFQALLDNSALNGLGLSIFETANTDQYLTYTDWAARDQNSKQNYIWDPNAQDYTDWQQAYAGIFTTNVVLDNLAQLQADSVNSERANAIKGSALFFRSYFLFNLAQAYSKPYNKQSASTELGIPLRTNSDINIKTTRATMSETYDRIISDIKQAVNLLPDTALYPTRPVKAAAYGVLARIFLTMSDYENAGIYADSSLMIRNTLLNYNSLNAGSTSPIPSYNTEVIFQSTLLASAINSPSRSKVDSNLYDMYDSNDLRKVIFFRNNGNGTYRFKGTYDGTYNAGSSAYFCGLAVDEMLLIRAESRARAGNSNDALSDLNLLLSNRYKEGTLVPLTATSSDDALKIVLSERRKELCFRGLRWMDLRRLNNEAGISMTLSRNLNGQTYILPPNDPRYTLLVPAQVLALASIPQNPR